MATWTVALIDPTGVDWSDPIAAKAAATTLYEALVETRTAIEAQNALMTSLAETPVQKAVKALNALFDLPVATGPAAYADALKPFNLTHGELDTAVSTSKVPTDQLGAILAALGVTSVGPVGPTGPTRMQRAWEIYKRF